MIKVGGALVRDPDAFAAATADLGALRNDLRIVLVPGGGPFADAVRDVDRTLGLGSDAAHWMAVLGMEQYAHLLGERIPGAIVIGDPAQLADAWHAGRVPVLAPYQLATSCRPRATLMGRHERQHCGMDRRDPSGRTPRAHQACARRTA